MSVESIEVKNSVELHNTISPRFGNGHWIYRGLRGPEVHGVADLSPGRGKRGPWKRARPNASGCEKPVWSSRTAVQLCTCQNDLCWRMGRDSNPRWAFDPYSLSRRVPSTARPPIRREALMAGERAVNQRSVRRSRVPQATIAAPSRPVICHRLYRVERSPKVRSGTWPTVTARAMRGGSALEKAEPRHL